MNVVSRAMHIVLVCLVMDTVCSELMFDEPQCSKYHFEERLLEKVVRFENKLDSMQARVDSLAENLTQEQRSLTDDRNQLLLDVQTLKDDIVADVQTIKDELGSYSSALRTDIEAKQAATDSQFQELIRTTQLQVERISNDAHSLTNKTSGDIKEPVSAFTVKAPQSAPDVNDVQNVIRFTIAVYNGVEYNTNTGVFSCKHAGLYYFALSLVKKRTSTREYDTVTAWIYKGTEQLMYAYLDPTDDDTDKGGYETSTFVTTHLVPGDTVFVGGGSNVERLNSYSSFSGFLVNAD